MKFTFIVFFSAFMFQNLVAQQEGEVFQFSNGSYCAAVKSDIFKFYVSKQKEDNWCWAACIEMALKYQGVQAEQEDIVKNALGSLINKPGNCYDMEQGASGWDVNGVTIQATQDFTPTVGEFVDALAHKYPVVIGLNMPGQNVGHAYVLTAIYYYRDASNRKVPTTVVLRDPWPSNPSKVEFQWSNFINRINCILYVTK